MFNPSYEVADFSEIGIHRLSPTEWLVRDPSIAEGDPTALLGIIQRIGDAYEVTKLHRLKERWYYSSFQRATASFAQDTRRRLELVDRPEQVDRPELVEEVLLEEPRGAFEGEGGRHGR